jgi:hypothetical protein
MMLPTAVLLAAAVAPIPDPEAPPPQPLRLALTSSSAFGLTGAKFFNQLIGARLEHRFTPRFAFGGALSYANLKGKDERVHNVLPEATTEYRIPLEPASVGLPLRLSLGFLPKNGPTLRIGAGIDFELSKTVSLELIPLEPMIWVVRERPEVSLNGGLALRLSL